MLPAFELWFCRHLAGPVMTRCRGRASELISSIILRRDFVGMVPTSWNMAFSPLTGLTSLALSDASVTLQSHVVKRHPLVRSARPRGIASLPPFGVRPWPLRSSAGADRMRHTNTLARTSHGAQSHAAALSHASPFQALAEGLAISTESNIALPDQRSVISWVRLLDSCPCSQCIHPSTRQKTRTSAESLRELREASTPCVIQTTDSINGQEGLRISWPSHTSFYPWDRLHRVARLAFPPSDYLKHRLRRVLWDEKTLLESSIQLRVRYDELHRAGEIQLEILLKVLEQLQVFGLVVIEGVPHGETSDADCQLRRFAGWIGQIRDTFYGQTWDVKNMKNSKNVAYTNLNLGLHMDLL